MSTNRREWLLRAGTMLGAGCGALAGLKRLAAAERFSLSGSDEAFLDELERKAFLYFWEAASETTGQIKDRSRADGPDDREIASIAATGFGLTALCIGYERRYAGREEIQKRVLLTLEWLANHQPQEHGFFYHFFNMHTGAREWNCELSSIDTSIALCGVLTCREYFDDPAIRALATKIYERVDWNWMRNSHDTVCHGWKPESGFLDARWSHYCEHMMIYLLGLGSPTHPLPTNSWTAWSRPTMHYGGFEYISGKDPLFVHQFSHAWFDFRGRLDGEADWFENSCTATRAHRQFCIDQGERFPRYGADLWGITASDSETGYQAWGGPPAIGRLDGSIVPCAAAGSLPFLPRESLHTLTHMREAFGARIWKRYGFVDAFNPHSNWTNPDVIGIDVGISMIMAENFRTGSAWNHFMRNEHVKTGMRRAGLV